jgi:hypothetical protein
MAEFEKAPSRRTTPDIVVDRSRWIQFLARFTRENRGAHARLVVLGPNIGYLVETQGRSFDAIGADVKDGENAAWIIFGSTLENHLTHGIQKVTTIRVRPAAGRVGAAVLIEVRDGTKTLLELSQREHYALPPVAVFSASVAA